MKYGEIYSYCLEVFRVWRLLENILNIMTNPRDEKKLRQEKGSEKLWE